MAPALKNNGGIKTIGKSYAPKQGVGRIAGGQESSKPNGVRSPAELYTPYQSPQWTAELPNELDLFKKKNEYGLESEL